IAGDRRVLGARARQLGKTITIHDYRQSKDVESTSLTVAHIAAPAPIVAGRLDVTNARYVLDVLDYALDGCMRGEFAAMVTAPVQKSVINDAGIPFSGHTEYLAERTGADLSVMMLVARSPSPLRVALATTHLPLAEVSRSITCESLDRVLTILDRDLRERFGI